MIKIRVMRGLFFAAARTVGSFLYSMKDDGSQASGRQQCDEMTILNPVIIPALPGFVTYSHGFGEGEDCNGGHHYYNFGRITSVPIYPDAPGKIEKAVFYTKPAVHKLARDLGYAVNSDKEGRDSIVLVGRSCGAGTAINCLERLIHYDKDYFTTKDGNILISVEDAKAIISAINNGALILTAPMLHLKKANLIAIPSSILSAITCALGTLGAYYYTPLGLINGSCSILTWLLAYYSVGGLMKNVYSAIIRHTLVQAISNMNYDPVHQHPLDAVEALRGKITCPILLHFHAEDGVLENPDDDVVKIYDALKGEKTHIVITNDADHNSWSRQFTGVLNAFRNQYIEKKGASLSLTSLKLKTDQLMQRIYPLGFISRIWESKKWATGLAITLCIIQMSANMFRRH